MGVTALTTLPQATTMLGSAARRGAARWNQSAATSPQASLDLKVGGMLDRSEHVDWLDRELKQGDVVTIRIVDPDQPSQQITRHHTDKAVEAAREREYYEHLRLSAFDTLESTYRQDSKYCPYVRLTL